MGRILDNKAVVALSKKRHEIGKKIIEQGNRDFPAGTQVEVHRSGKVYCGIITGVRDCYWDCPGDLCIRLDSTGTDWTFNLAEEDTIVVAVEETTK